MLAAGLAAVVAPATARARERDPGGLGLVIHSFPVRTAGDRNRRPEERFADPIRFLEYARSLGARGAQVGIGTREAAYADDLRARAEAASMKLEGIVSPPRDESDLARFEADALGHRVGRFARTQQRAAPQRPKLVLGRTLGQFPRLAVALLIERYRQLPLEATLKVVRRLAMTGQIDAGGSGHGCSG